MCKYMLTAAFAGLLAMTAAPSDAAMIQLQMEGVNIAYDGSSIASTTSPDPLINVSFLQDEVLLGSDAADVTLDLEVTGVTGLIDSAANSVGSTGGSLSLDLGAGQFLDLTLSSGTVTFVPGGFVNFAFLALPATVDDQDLPFGLNVADPVSVSFSTQLVGGTLATDGNDTITAFRASGTGEISAVPEPASLALIALAGVVTFGRGRRRA